MTIRNAGSATATGVTATDVLPDHVTFVGASDGGSFANGEVVWNVGSVAPGAAVTRTVTVRVNNTVPAGVTSITNEVTAEDDGANGSDPTPADNTATDTDTLAVAPDLAVTKTDDLGAAVPGQTLTYVVTIRNVGNQGATGVTAADTIPPDTTFVGASVGGVFDGVNTVRWAVGSLPAGASVTRTVTVTVNNPVPAGPTGITNTVSVADDGANGNDPPGNNTATDTDGFTAAPDLTVGKTDGVSQAQPGDTLTYTVTVRNVGNQGATGVRLFDTIPANTTLVGTSDPGSTFAGGVVTFGIGGLAVWRSAASSHAP